MKKKLAIGLLLILLVSSLAIPILSMAMYTPSPQSMTIVVIHPPKDLEISIVDIPDLTHLYYWGYSSSYFYPRVSSRMWETYYHFNLCTEPAGTWGYDEITMLVNSEAYGKFQITFPVPQRDGVMTSNFTINLNLENQSFTVGNSLPRNLLILLIWLVFLVGSESLIFFLFGYRTKQSWQPFIMRNFIVQSAFMINWFLLHMIFTRSLILLLFTLIAGILIPGIRIAKWVAESIVFKKFIDEHSKRRGKVCVSVMNMVGMCIVILLASYLPLPAL